VTGYSGVCLSDRNGVKQSFDCSSARSRNLPSASVAAIAAPFSNELLD
jgi:hypothetical protein